MSIVVRASREDEESDHFYIQFFEGILRREPKYLEVLEPLAMLYTKVKDHDNGLRIDRKIVRLDPDNETAHYNLACSLSLKGRPLEALRSLKKSVELGYDDWEHLEEDPDLEAVRAHRDFAEWFATVTDRSS